MVPESQFSRFGFGFSPAGSYYVQGENQGKTNQSSKCSRMLEVHEAGVKDFGWKEGVSFEAIDRSFSSITVRRYTDLLRSHLPRWINPAPRAIRANLTTGIRSQRYCIREIIIKYKWIKFTVCRACGGCECAFYRRSRDFYEVAGAIEGNVHPPFCNFAALALNHLREDSLKHSGRRVICRNRKFI